MSDPLLKTSDLNTSNVAADYVRVNRRIGTSLKPKDISIHRSYYTSLNPTGLIPTSGGGQMFYSIPAEGSAFIDLRNSFMEVYAMMTNVPNIGSYVAMCNTCPKNGLGDMLWTSVLCQISGESCNDLTNGYHGISSFMRRCLIKPSGWSGQSQKRLVATNATLGKQLSFPPSSSVPEIISLGFLTSSSFGTKSGRGDSMFYYLNHSIPQLIDYFDAYNNVSVHSFIDCEAQQITMYNSNKEARMVRTVQNGIQDSYDYNGNLITPANIVTRKFSFLSWPISLFNTLDMYLPPNTPVNLQLTRAPDALILDSPVGTSPGLTIFSCKLWVRYVEPTESCMKSYMMLLAEAGIVIPYVRSYTAPITVPAGTLSVNASGLIAGSRPDIIMVAMSVSVGLTGSYNYFPLALAPNAYPTNYNVVGPAVNVGSFAQLTITFGGVQYPQIVISPDPDIGAFPNGNVDLACAQLRAYELYVSCCIRGYDDEASPLLSYSEWCNNYTIYCIDLRGSASDEAGKPGTVTDGDSKYSGSLSISGLLVQPTIIENTCLILGIGSGDLIFNSSGNCRREGF